MNKIPVIRSSMQTYESTRENRQLVQPDELIDGESYLLFMKNEGSGAGSYLTKVYVDNLQAEGSHRVVLTDQASQPSYAIDSTNRNGLWTPDRHLQARDRMAEIAISQGLLLPVDTELDIDDVFNRSELKITDELGVHTDRPFIGRSTV